jgi:hypothetical protein
LHQNPIRQVILRQASILNYVMPVALGRLEATQMHQAERLFKLAVVGLAAACRTIQLVDARNGSARPATDVIDAALLSVAEAIGPTLEGNTERQKNPHLPHSLAWLAWIIARLGGWNCYYKPPGPKTMRAGPLAPYCGAFMNFFQHGMQ